MFSPIAFMAGVPWVDAGKVGMLIGKKIFLNEFLAYLDLSAMKESLQPRSFTLSTYALCGFANFSSIAIQIGGIGALVPERRKDLAKLGLRAMCAGALTSLLTTSIVGVLLP